jgi:hypothetical protein
MRYMSALAVGVPVLTGPAQGWNFWPLVGVPIVMVIAFGWWRLGATALAVTATLLIGLISADAIRAWGVLPVVLGVACLAAVGSTVRRRGCGSDPPTV